MNSTCVVVTAYSVVSDRAGDSSGVEVVDDVVVCGDDTLLLDALCDTSNGYKYRLDRGGGVITARAAAPAKQVRHRCSSNSKGPTGPLHAKTVGRCAWRSDLKWKLMHRCHAHNKTDP